MLRKRSHQAFTDMEAEQPLSPVLRPPHQEMGSSDSGSDGDEVMDTGDTSTLLHQTESQPACALHIHCIFKETRLSRTHPQVCLSTWCDNTCA